MPGYTVASHRQRIEATFDRAAAVTDLQTQADLARYLCVLTSGFLEQAIRHLYGQHANRSASPRVFRYVERRLEFFQNPNSQKLIALAGDFDQAWRTDLEDFLIDERRDHVDSVVANKNQIAHGENVGITYMRANDYFESVVEVVEFIDQQCS
jgi:HEPN superfamily RiboL-PSP-like protein